MMKQPANSSPFVWQSPWLDTTGDVWVYQGYGEFALLPPSHPRARDRLRCLEANVVLRASEEKRLRTRLEIENSSRHWQRIADTMEQLVPLIRSGA